MSHISQHGPKARATDHAVRRYAERHLGVTVETEDDRVAVNLLRAKGLDLSRIRARIADIGGVIMSTGRTSGDCIAFPEALRFRLVDGKVVTVMEDRGEAAAACPRQRRPRSGPSSRSEATSRDRPLLQLRGLRQSVGGSRRSAVRTR